MIAKDKIGHFKAGAIIAFLVSAVIIVINMFLQDAVGEVIDYAHYGLLAGLLAGIGKEAKDYIENMIAVKNGKKEPHSVEFMDFWFTVMGSIVTLVVLRAFF